MNKLSLVSSIYRRDAEGPGESGSQAFLAEEALWVRDKGTGDKTVEVGTLLEPFMNKSLRTSGLGTILLICPKYQLPGFMFH